MWIDDWGNKYESVKTAEKNIKKICTEGEDFWMSVSDDMCMPSEIMTWIMQDEKRFKDFKKDFHAEIKMTAESLCDYYITELQYFEE